LRCRKRQGLMLQGAYNLWGWRKTGIQNIRNDYTWNLGLTHTPHYDAIDLLFG